MQLLPMTFLRPSILLGCSKEQSKMWHYSETNRLSSIVLGPKAYRGPCSVLKGWEKKVEGLGRKRSPRKPFAGLMGRRFAQEEPAEGI